MAATNPAGYGMGPTTPGGIGTTATGGTATTSTTTQPPTLVTPTMGGTVQLTKKEWAAWTGGIPLSDWSGLDPKTAFFEPVSPNQYRPVFSGAAQKAFIHRKKGMDDKFDKKGDLKAFQKKLVRHLVDTGMDTIAYLPDPKDATKMVNVVTYHARFTVASARNAVQAIKAKPTYDRFDRLNDLAARQFLMDSLATELAERVDEKLEDDDSFVTAWVQLIRSTVPASIERYESLKERLKKIHPSHYGGENLEQMAAEFRRIADELVAAGQYNHNLTLDMLAAFTKAGGAGNEEFRHPLWALKEKLSTALSETAHVDDDVRDAEMIRKDLTYKDICSAVEDRYRLMMDRGLWPAAKHAKDSKAVPAKFVGANMADMPICMTRADVMALIQQQGGSNDGANNKGTCFNCGSKDHWMKDCPKLKGKQGRQGRRNDKDNKNSWKFKPPGRGEKESKEVNGKTFCWRAACSPPRWSTTHNTAGHTGPVKKGKKNGTANPAANKASAGSGLVQDPSAWFSLVDDVPNGHHRHGCSCSDDWINDFDQHRGNRRNNKKKNTPDKLNDIVNAIKVYLRFFWPVFWTVVASAGFSLLFSVVVVHILIEQGTMGAIGLLAPLSWLIVGLYLLGRVEGEPEPWPDPPRHVRRAYNQHVRRERRPVRASLGCDGGRGRRRLAHQVR